MPKKKTTPAPEAEETKAVEVVEVKVDSETKKVKEVKEIKKAGRSPLYKKAKAKVDSKELYTLEKAINLAKETSYSKFPGKLEAHIVTIHTPGNLGEISFPHLETVSKKIVVASDAVLAELKEGKVNFDILVSTPAVMTKLLPFARLLGPKGLMPNPKNGTLSEDTAAAVKKLSVAKQVVKTEKSAPVVHMTVGKLEQPVKELVANIEELIKVLGGATKIKKTILSATMGPGIKVKLN